MVIKLLLFLSKAVELIGYSFYSICIGQINFLFLDEYVNEDFHFFYAPLLVDLKEVITILCGY